ncbi:MAG: type II toxin-antitoxin system Phd/YefM family antitoxin [Acidimicrobiales bacterium]
MLIGPDRAAGLLRIGVADAEVSSEHWSLADVKNRLSEVVDKLEREHGRIVVTKHGRPAAVMLNVDDLESLEETLAILSTPILRDAIREGDTEIAAGRTERLTKDEAFARVSKK